MADRLWIEGLVLRERLLVVVVVGLKGVQGHEVVYVHVAIQTTDDDVSVFVGPGNVFVVACVVVVLWGRGNMAGDPDLHVSLSEFARVTPNHVNSL